MTHPSTLPDRAASLPNAQTTVQLFEQLRRQDYPDADLRRVRAACAAGLELFAGRMHSSGKPYVAHCTAAASTLAALGARADLVIAGLLHGAYRWGDFGSWRVFLPLERRYLRRHFGAPVERSVFAFHMLPWNLEAISALSDRLAGLDPASREIVLMRLVSELDNLRSLTLLYRADAEPARQVLKARGPILVRMAGLLGCPALSQALDAAVVDTLTGSVAPELRSDLGAGALLAPASSRLRLEAVLARAAGGALRRLRQTLKR